MEEPQGPEEARLIEEARGGSARAFSDLVRMHQARVRGSLSRYIRSWDVVDDLAQETFVRAHENLPSYRGEAPFRLWLLSIARNRALSCLREESRRRMQGGDALEAAVAGWLAEEIQSESPGAPLRERELEALRTCVRGLPGASAALVEDFYFRKHSAAEIARRSGRKEGLVRMTLLRIRAALRRCIQSKLAQSEAACE